MRPKTGGFAALTGMLAAFAMAAPAQAGIYTVYACNAAGRLWDNRSWEQNAPVNGVAADQDCSGDGNIGLNQRAGERTADGAHTALQFLTPAGTAIADFRLTKRSTARAAGMAIPRATPTRGSSPSPGPASRRSRDTRATPAA